jgi:hypothetical protein
MSWRPSPSSNDDLLIERVQSRLQRAWAEGKKSGRRAALTEDQCTAVPAALEAGQTGSALARQYDTSRQTILRSKAAAWASGERRTLVPPCMTMLIRRLTLRDRKPKLRLWSINHEPHVVARR